MNTLMPFRGLQCIFFCISANPQLKINLFLIHKNEKLTNIMYLPIEPTLFYRFEYRYKRQLYQSNYTNTTTKSTKLTNIMYLPIEPSQLPSNLKQFPWRRRHVVAITFSRAPRVPILRLVHIGVKHGVLR